jgi:hypothetical protein
MKERNTKRIDLAELVERERIKTAESLRRSIESFQETLIREYRKNGWERSTAYPKTIVTILGRVTFTVIKVRKRRGQRFIVNSPILDLLCIRKRKYSREVRMVCADMAATVSYGETKSRMEKTNHLKIPKRTIHSFGQEVGRGMARKVRREQRALRRTTAATTHHRAATENPPIVMADGTKTHSVYATNNDVRVAITYGNDGRAKLLGLAVNRGWETIPKPSEPHILVSDGETSIVNNLASDPDHTQLDLVHAVKEALFKLWGERMPLEQRQRVSTELSRILFTLVNSVKKHRQDGDMDAIEARVESTLKELNELAENLRTRGYARASEFISQNAKLMVTFAKLAISGIEIPYTSNAIERLMGAIARRCKHGWMHWSTRGLENLLWILLVRYLDEQAYNSFWL